MVRRAYELWEELDASTDEQLYTETGALWLHRGDDAYVRSSLPILEELGFPVDRVPLEDAARRYPQIAFKGVRSVYLERRAGALSARKACEVVRDAFVRAGGTYRVASAQPAAGSVKLDDGTALEADAYVFACGPWLGKLFPEVIGERVRPTRQEVYYFGTPRGSNRYRPEALPVWIDFGERIVYGIPDIHGRGFKLADDTRGEPIDPSTTDRRASEEGLARARSLLKERFPELAAAPLIASEVCQYENSPDGHFIIDQHPSEKNFWIAGGGSGHGFKLSPAAGEMVARAILGGGEIPSIFKLARLRNFETPKTQFERK
jgi:glycine/D-amino acid oxidase-like deaminating enzyme